MLDELVHVELCARMAMELGGGTEIVHDPNALIVDPDPELPPLLRAADLVVRCFCVGEALSIPLLRGTWKAARHPLPRAVLGRIVKDEAAHGTFGFAFFDWALPTFPRTTARCCAGRGSRIRRSSIANGRDSRNPQRAYDESVGDALAWMQSDAYLELAARSMKTACADPSSRAAFPSQRGRASRARSRPREQLRALDARPALGSTERVMR